MSAMGLIRTATVMALLAALAAPAWADRDKWDKRDRQRPDNRGTPERSEPRGSRQQDTPVIRREDRDRGQRDHRDGDRRTRPANVPRGYVLDRRYDRNRYYPPTGYRVPRLPRGHRVYHHHRRPYYYYSGSWYLHTGAYFVVTMPPVGLTVSVLPPYYTTVWIGGVPYYYANGVYYVWQPVQRVYVVTDPPPASAVSEQPTEPDKLFIYPKQGQSAEQQASDRYQCHTWATEQSGFDPTRAGGGVAVEQYVSKRADYHRAIKACLEARGYSVK